MVADQAAARHVEREPHLTAARRPHVLQHALTPADLLNDHARVVVVDVDQHVLERLLARTGLLVLTGQHPGAADRELKSLAAHLLDQHAQLQLAAAGDFERVALVAVGDFDSNVAFTFTQQTVADLPARDLLAFLAAERPVIDAERHGQRGRIDRDGGQGCGQLRCADRIRHRGVGEARYGYDVAGLHFVHLDPIEPAIAHELRQAPGLDHRTVGPHHFDGHIQAGTALFHAAGQHPTQEVVVVENGGDHRERSFLVEHRRRHVPHDQVEQRRQVLARPVHRVVGPALPAGRVQHGEVELLVIRAERCKQVEDLVMNLVGPRVLAVDFIHHHDRLDAARQRLRHHELGLRQRALGRIDQHQHAVDHV